MKKKYADKFISTMINNFNYALIELEGAAEYKPSWAAKSEEEGQRFVIFLDESNLEFYRYYRNIVLGNTEGAVDINAIIFLNNNNKELISKTAYDLGINGVLVNEEEYNVSYLGNVPNYLQDSTSRIAGYLNKVKENEENRFDKVTKILILINILVYLVSTIVSVKLGGNIIEIDNMALFKLGANLNIKYMGIVDIYRFVTSMFLHGGLIHLIFNMYALYALGPLVAEVFGKKKYIAIYFISGILASVVSSLFLRGIGIGASGAIFGLLGAILVYGMKNKSRVGKEFIKNIVIVIILNLIMGMSISNIDQMAHIGGLIGGAIVALIFTIKNKSELI